MYTQRNPKVVYTLAIMRLQYWLELLGFVLLLRRLRFAE